ncbi:hypothetical protein BLNAU_9817 [Blattamonas nauphoetae]|uniref:Uncharacterized protein n=1 Tax=Blattamonas nauphoetae TaxID=2049346 RepID=A0ABQ9XUX0_9EUKA|nr:hypothetical protein BLNAU_9817 [Blattamonas nauphoetae]
MSGYCLYIDSVQDIPEDPKIRERLENCSFYHRLHISFYDSNDGSFLGDTYESIPYNPIETSTGVFSTEIKDLLYFLCPDEISAIIIIEVVCIALDQYNRVKREIGLGFGCFPVASSGDNADLSQFEKKSFYPLMQQIPIASGTPCILMCKKDISFDGGSNLVPDAFLQLTLVTHNRLSMLTPILPSLVIFDERNGSSSIPGLLPSHISTILARGFKHDYDEAIQALESDRTDSTQTHGRGSPSRSRTAQEKRKKDNKARKLKKKELQRIIQSDVDALQTQRNSIIACFAEERKRGKKKQTEALDTTLMGDTLDFSPKKKKHSEKHRRDESSSDTDSFGFGGSDNDIESDFDEIVEEKNEILPSLTEDNWTNNPFWNSGEFRDHWTLPRKERASEERGRTAIEMIGAQRLVVGSKVFHGQIRDAPWFFGRTLFRPIPQEKIPLELRNVTFLLPQKIEETVKTHLNYVRLTEQLYTEPSTKEITLTGKRLFIIPHSDLGVCGDIESRDLVSSGNAARKKMKVGSTTASYQSLSVSDPKVITLKSAFAHPKYAIMFAILFTFQISIDTKPPDKKAKTKVNVNLPQETTRTLWIGWDDYHPFKAPVKADTADDQEYEEEEEEEDDDFLMTDRNAMEKLKEQVILSIPDLSDPVVPPPSSPKKAAKTLKTDGKKRGKTPKLEENVAPKEDEQEPVEEKHDLKKIQLKLNNQYPPPSILNSIPVTWLYNPSRGVNPTFRKVVPAPTQQNTKSKKTQPQPKKVNQLQPVFETVFPFDKLHPYETPYYTQGPYSTPSALTPSETTLLLSFSLTLPPIMKDWDAETLRQPALIPTILPPYLHTPQYHPSDAEKNKIVKHKTFPAEIGRLPQQNHPSPQTAPFPAAPRYEPLPPTAFAAESTEFSISSDVSIGVQSMQSGLNEKDAKKASQFVFSFASMTRSGLTDPQGFGISLPRRPQFVFGLFDKMRVETDVGMLEQGTNESSRIYSKDSHEPLSIQIETGSATLPFHTPPPTALSRIPFTLTGSISPTFQNSSTTLPDSLNSTPIQVDIYDAESHIIFGTSYLSLASFSSDVSNGQESSKEFKIPILVPFPSPENLSGQVHHSLHQCHLYPLVFTTPPESITLGILTVRVTHKRVRPTPVKQTPEEVTQMRRSMSPAPAIANLTLSPHINRALTSVATPTMHSRDWNQSAGFDSLETKGNPLEILLLRTENDMTLFDGNLVKVANRIVNPVAQSPSASISQERKKTDIANLRMLSVSKTRVIFPSFAAPLVFDIPFQNPLSRKLKVTVSYFTLTGNDSATSEPSKSDTEHEIRLLTPQQAQFVKNQNKTESKLSDVSSISPPFFEDEVTSFIVPENQTVNVSFLFQSFAWVASKQSNDELRPAEGPFDVDDYSLLMKERVVEIAFSDEQNTTLLLQHVVICPTPIAPTRVVRLFTSAGSQQTFNLDLFDPFHAVPYRHSSSSPFVKRAVLCDADKVSSASLSASVITTPQPHLSLKCGCELSDHYRGESFHIAFFNDDQCLSLFGVWTVSIVMPAMLRLNSTVGELVEKTETFDRARVIQPVFHTSPLAVHHFWTEIHFKSPPVFSAHPDKREVHTSDAFLAGECIRLAISLHPDTIFPDPSQELYIISVNKPLSAVPLQTTIRVAPNGTATIPVRIHPVFFEGTSSVSFGFIFLEIMSIYLLESAMYLP